MTDTNGIYAKAILFGTNIFKRHLLKFLWREYSYPLEETSISQCKCSFSLGYVTDLAYVFGMNFARFISCPLHISNRSKQALNVLAVYQNETENLNQ